MYILIYLTGYKKLAVEQEDLMDRIGKEITKKMKMVIYWKFVHTHYIIHVYTL